MPVAVPALAAVIFALLALLLLYGAKLFGRGLLALVPRSIPLIGHALYVLVSAGVAVVEVTFDAIFSGFIRPVIGMIAAPVIKFLDFLAGLVRFSRTMAASWVWLVANAIPDLVAKIRAWTWGLYKAARTYAAGLYHQALSYAHKLWVDARAYALSVYRQTVAYAASLYHKALTYAATLYHQAIAYALAEATAARVYAAALVKAGDALLAAELAKAEARITAIEALTTAYVDTAVAKVLSTAEAFTVSEVSKAITVVDVESVALLAGVWDGLITDVGALTDVIGLDLPDIGAAVRAIPRAIPADLADALPLIGTLAIPMLRYMRECGVPNCRNLGKVGRDLQQLFSAIEGAGFLALLAYLVGDPIGAAHEVESVLGPIANDTAAVARNLLGV